MTHALSHVGTLVNVRWVVAHKHGAVHALKLMRRHAHRLVVHQQQQEQQQGQAQPQGKGQEVCVYVCGMNTRRVEEFVLCPLLLSTPPAHQPINHTSYKTNNRSRHQPHPSSTFPAPSPRSTS